MAKPPSPKPLSHCLFCGQPFGQGRRRSAEHIWPQWMHHLLPDQDSPGGGGLVRQDPYTLETTYHEVHQTQGKIINTMRPRVVCEECNNGWMSRLDDRTKPLLQEMIAERPAVLHADDQAVLAAWFFMKNAVAEARTPSSRATSDLSRAILFRNHLAPPYAAIWIARNHGQFWKLRYHHTAGARNLGVIEPLSEHVPMNFQVATLAIGPVVFQLFCGSGGYPLVPSPKGVFIDTVLRIWPPPTELVEWPPTALTDAETRRLGDQMWHWLKRKAEALESGQPG
jgi:hypothetical protein